LVDALRPEDGGVADRGDLGSFVGHAFGVYALDVAAPSPSGASAVVPPAPGSETQ
jgi:hypothetical protein